MSSEFAHGWTENNSGKKRVVRQKTNGSLVQSGPPKGGVSFSMCEASSEKGVG